MRSVFLGFILSLCFAFVHSQRLFSIDKYGIMTDSIEIKNLQSKYQLIGMFQKVSDNSEMRRARVLKKIGNEPYWGFIDQTGKEIIPTKYTSESVFTKYGYAKVKEKLTFTNKYDCGNVNPCVRNEVLPFYYFVDKDGNQISDYFKTFENPYDAENFLIIVVNGKQRIIDRKNLKTIYESRFGGSINVYRSDAGKYFILESNKDGKQDLINEKGEPLTNFRYDRVYIYNNLTFGLIEHKDKSRHWFLLDEKFKPYNDSLYIDDNSGSLNDYVIDDVAALKNDKGYFLVNKNGKIISDRYLQIWKAGKAFIVSDDGGKTRGLLNTKGKLAVTISEYPDIYPIQNERFITFGKGKEGEKKYYIFDSKTNKLHDFNETLYIPYSVKKYIMVGDKENHGIRNSNLKLIVPKDYKGIFPVGDTGYFVATNKDGKMGIINEKNQIIIPFMYDGIADSYFNMSAPFKEEERNHIENYWFVMNKDGKQGIVNYKNETVFPFDTHHIGIWPQFKIWKGNKMGFITKSRKIIPMEYDDYMEIDVENGLYYLIKNGKFGVVNEDNKILVPFDREVPERVFGNFYAERYFLFYKNGRYKMVEKGGKMFYPEELYSAPGTMKEGIGIANDFLLDIYKNKLETGYYLEGRIDEDDF